MFKNKFDEQIDWMAMFFSHVLFYLWNIHLTNSYTIYIYSYVGMAFTHKMKLSKYAMRIRKLVRYCIYLASVIWNHT